MLAVVGLPFVLVLVVLGLPFLVVSVLLVVPAFFVVLLGFRCIFWRFFPRPLFFGFKWRVRSRLLFFAPMLSGLLAVSVPVLLELWVPLEPSVALAPLVS